MIQLIEGPPPRSGKSCFSVRYLVKFTTYDELYNEYILQDDTMIISNIEGLRIRHWTLNHCLGLKPHEKLSAATDERINEFFSIENFENIKKTMRKTHIVLVIDEVHELFPAGYKNKTVYEFFCLSWSYWA